MADHGTRSRYSYELCRCDKCVEANAEYLKRYRAGDVARARAESEKATRIGQACAAYLSKRHPRIYRRIVEACDGD